MDREDTEKRVISALVDIITAGRLDDVEGDGRETSCYCSDSNGVVKIQDIFRAFEAHYDLIPKSEMVFCGADQRLEMLINQCPMAYSSRIDSSPDFCCLLSAAFFQSS